MLEIFTYRTVTVVYFTDQNWISKTVYCIRCVMVCKIGFTNWNAKIALLRASMVVTYYIKLFRTEADRHNGILMSLLLLVAEKKVLFICLMILNHLKPECAVIFIEYITSVVLLIFPMKTLISNEMVLPTSSSYKAGAKWATEYFLLMHLAILSLCIRFIEA